MKIAIKVSDISSLLNYNNFKTRDIVIKNIKSRLYRTCKFENIKLTDNITNNIKNKVENIIKNFKPVTDDIDLEKIIKQDNILSKEFDNFYIYCFENELSYKDGILIDKKKRISQKVKNFIPIIDLVHIQFYMLLSNYRRCLLDELWDDGYIRKTYIKFDQNKIDNYLEMLNNVITDII